MKLSKKPPEHNNFFIHVSSQSNVNYHFFNIQDAKFYFVGQLDGCHAYNSGLLAYPSPETTIKNNLSRRANPVGENVSCHASNVVTSLGFHTGFFPTGLQS